MDTQEYQLEEIIDKVGLGETLELLSQICYGKAEHLRSNWQDPITAETWEKDASTIDDIASRIVNV